MTSGNPEFNQDYATAYQEGYDEGHERGFRRAWDRATERKSIETESAVARALAQLGPLNGPMAEHHERVLRELVDSVQAVGFVRTPMNKPEGTEQNMATRTKEPEMPLRELVREVQTPEMETMTTATMQDDFTQSFDARDWAKAFVERAQKDPAFATDEGTMIGWFANAIMRGYDEAQRASAPPLEAPTTPEDWIDPEMTEAEKRDLRGPSLEAPREPR